MTEELIIPKLSQLSEDLKVEVLHYVDFLLTKFEKKSVNVKRKAGSAKGMIFMSDDFDEPLEDFKDYI
jgi:Protein of unknown function (DUF2281)